MKVHVCRFRMTGWPHWLPLFVGPSIVRRRGRFSGVDGVTVNFGPSAFHITISGGDQ